MAHPNNTTIWLQETMVTEESPGDMAPGYRNDLEKAIIFPIGGLSVRLR